MKNHSLLFILFIFSIGQMNAQYSTKNERLFKKGQTDIQVGYGLFAPSVIFDHADTKLPPISIRLSRFFGKQFSVDISYGQSIHKSQPIENQENFPQQRVINNTKQIFVRPALHIFKLPNTDFYGGVAFGINIQRFSVDEGTTDYLEYRRGFQSKIDKFAFKGFVGARYAFNKKWSAFGEAGGGGSLLTVGVGYQL